MKNRKNSNFCLGFAVGKDGAAVLLRVPRCAAEPEMAAMLTDGRFVLVKSFADVNPENESAVRSLAKAYPMAQVQALFAPIWRAENGA